MQRTEALFLFAVALFLTGFCLLGLFHYAYSATLLRFPLLAAGVTLFLICCRLVLLHREQGAGGPDLMETPRTVLVEVLGAARRGHAVVSMLWMIAILPLVFVLGWPLGMAVYLLCALRHFGEAWPLAIAISLSSLVLSYGLFIAVLGVPLPVLPVWWPLVGS